MPCGTGLSHFELVWAGGSASGAKLSNAEYEAEKDASMVIDFPGWVDEDSLDRLFPSIVIMGLFRDFRGRFRPIIPIAENIIQMNNPLNWDQYIDKRIYRLTTADVPTTGVGKGLLEKKLCGELRRVFDRVEADPATFMEYQNIKATLKFAMAAFKTQGGFLAYKGELPELVEMAFGRIRKYNGERYTTIDLPFVFRTIDNFFQKTDPGYLQHQTDMLLTGRDETSGGKYWETMVPTKMEEVFHGRVIPTDLFNGAEIPHEMFHRKVEIIGWTGVMQTTGHEEMSMQEFLNAHYYHDSERNGDLMPPFFFPDEQVSGPDIVFVVRFIAPTADGSADVLDIKCPVFVQIKLRTRLNRPDAEKARATVQPAKIHGHGIDIGHYCKPHKHYISLIVSYPAEVAKHFKNEPLTMKHRKDITEIALTNDNKNIHSLFAAEYVTALKHVRRLGSEMTARMERAKQARTWILTYQPINAPAYTH
ncbi:hypothetical protein BGZ54_002366 [Gamsiella multidivaricata]|nr:hypothetical protein BGZ54_002366 [Gamsiella multidivaricata]